VKRRTLLDAGTVAREGLEAALRGDPLVVPGAFNKLHTMVPRILPRTLLPRLVRSAQAPVSN